MTTGRINQVTIFTRSAQRPRTRRPRLPPEAGTKFVDGWRGGRSLHTSSPGLRGVQTRAEYPGTHPIAPTELLRGTVRRRYGGTIDPTVKTPRTATSAPRVEDTGDSSHPETATSFGGPPSVYGIGWPSANYPQTPSVPARTSRDCRPPSSGHEASQRSETSEPFAAVGWGDALPRYEPLRDRIYRTL